MLDFHLCLSGSVNVRYVLYTQPLGLYNKILVWVSLYPSLLDCPSHLQHLLLLFHAILSSPSSFLSYLINPYCSGGKRQNLQCLWPQQQCRESTTSQLHVGHVDVAFRDLGENATSKIRGDTHRRKNPCQERSSMMLARFWVNGLRSNVTPLKLCKLDIGSTCNNLWVRWATLIGISLVLFHHPHLEVPKPLLSRSATTT
jgi:hypothetical protein